MASIVALENDTEALAEDRRAGFAAAVALYPRCATQLGSWRANSTGVYQPVAPVLILIGEKDDWTPAEPCRKLTEAAKEAGHPVAIKIYPGRITRSTAPGRCATLRHASTPIPTGRGATTGGDPTAWADSIREVVAFFGQHLK